MSATFSEPGRRGMLVPTPPFPGNGHLTVMLSNRRGQTASDTLSVR